MTTFWTQLEALSGARLDGEHCYFDAETTSELIAAPLRHYGFLQLQGPDAHTFLQGQTTADFRKVSVRQAQPGAYCTPKGRMVSSFVAACPAENTVLLRMRRDILENTKTVLSKYAVFSKVELRLADDDYIGIGLAGDGAAEVVERLFEERLTTQFATTVSPAGLAVQTDTEGKRFELWLEAQTALNQWQQLVKTVQAASSTHWDELAIEAGLADVCAATVESLIPQMLNYDATGAINFKKGCYTGQEVVARLHYRGTAKRRLYRAQASGKPVQEGDEIFASDKAQAVGVVATASPSGKALVVLARDAATDSSLHTGSGASLHSIEPPPYPIKDE